MSIGEERDQYRRPTVYTVRTGEERDQYRKKIVYTV